MDFIKITLLGTVRNVKQTNNGKFKFGVHIANGENGYWVNVFTDRKVEDGDYVFLEGELNLSDFNGKTYLNVFPYDLHIIKRKGGKNAQSEENI